jgi:ATP-binding cassette, subfamily B, bacterial
MTASVVEAGWRRCGGRWITVRAPEGSYAARQAPKILREMERAVQVLEELLQPPAEKLSAPLEIHLLDAAPFLPGIPQPAAGDGSVIVYAMQPEASRDRLLKQVVAGLLERWFGSQAAAAGPVADGLAGVVAARTGIGPSEAEADRWVRERVSDRRAVSILARFSPAGAADPSAEDAPALDPAATSFTAFLLREYGPALGEFLRVYEPPRRDAAAVAVLKQPLAALEQGWQARLQRRQSAAWAMRALLANLLPALKPYRWRLLEVLLYTLYSVGYSVGVPLLAEYILKEVVPNRAFSVLLALVPAFLLLSALLAWLDLRRVRVTHWINVQVILGLRARLFEKVNQLSHRYFSRVRMGDLAARFTEDVQLVQIALAQVTENGVHQALMAATAGAIIILRSWQARSPVLALVLLIIPVLTVIFLKLQAQLQEQSRELQQRSGAAAATVQEGLAGQAVIKAFGLEAQTLSVYEHRLDAVEEAALGQVAAAAKANLSIAMALMVARLLILGLGGYLAMIGRLHPATLLLLWGLLPLLFSPVATVAMVGQTVQRAAGAIERIAELLDEPADVTDRQDAVPLPPFQDSIRLEDVRFGYDPGRMVLNDVNLTIKAGESVAIVGPSGSGKSTVANLILRFWDPSAGRVLIDGHDLRQVTLASLRSQIAIVFQETFIFATTVRENIAIARPDATDAEIAAAAEAAGLKPYIDRLPAGYDTLLSERGSGMSGGERQRLSIARALLRQPRILILDEATSALDAKTSASIMETLARSAHGRTTISITHRLAQAAVADRIYVIESGRIAEAGTHPELMTRGGIYQQLYEEQNPLTGLEHVAIELLRGVPLFAGLEEGALVVIAEELVVERYPAGAKVVVQGEPGDRFYILNEGEAEVLIEDRHGRRRVNLLTEGDYFGEVALLTQGGVRSSTVRAITPVELYSLAHDDLTALMEREPAIREAVAEALEKRSRILPEGMRLLPS